MKTPALSRELALRIGLAARCLGDAGPAPLMAALVDTLGMPLTELKFAGLTLAQLREAAGGVLGEVRRAMLREALAYLQGRTPILVVDEPRPQPENYKEGDMPGSLRLAVAAEEGERIDGHFGNCPHFLIYQVSATDVRLVACRAAPAGNRRNGRDARRTELLDDCQLLYARTLSNAAAARLMTTGIHPIAFPDGGPAREKIAELQTILRGTPPPWLARAIGNPLALPPRLGRNGPVLVHSPSKTLATMR